MSEPIELDNSLAGTFIDSFDDLEVFPESFTPLIPTYLNPAKLSEEHRERILAKCTTILGEGGNYNDAIDFPLWYRCATVWFAVTGQKHSSVRALEGNLIVSEVNVTDPSNVSVPQQQRLEFDELEGVPLKDPLCNMILEEVEVTHYLGGKPK